MLLCDPVIIVSALRCVLENTVEQQSACWLSAAEYSLTCQPYPPRTVLRNRGGYGLARETTQNTLYLHTAAANA